MKNKIKKVRDKYQTKWINYILSDPWKTSDKTYRTTLEEKRKLCWASIKDAI